MRKLCVTVSRAEKREGKEKKEWRVDYQREGENAFLSRQDKLTVSFIRGVVTKTGYEKWWLLMAALNELGEQA